MKQSLKAILARGRPGEFPEKVHNIDDPDLIWEMLADPKNNLSLSHYDRLMFDLKQPIALLLGEDQCQSYAWKIFAKALSLEKTSPKNKDASETVDFNSSLSRNSSELISKLAKTHSKGVIKELKKNSSPRFNIIREYGYFVPFLVGLQFTGLSNDVKFSKGAIAFTIMRNLYQKSWGKGRMKLSDPHKAANSYLLWTHFLLGQVFSNFGNRTNPTSKIKHKLAGWASEKYFQQIRSSLIATKNKDGNHEEDYNLRRRLSNVRFRLAENKSKLNELDKSHSDKIMKSWHQLSEKYRAIPEGENIDYINICILFEIMMSFHILIGISFSRILDEIIAKGETLQGFSTQLKNSPDPDAIINAYLAKNSPTAELYRISRRAIPEHGIKMGDAICFKIQKASVDLVENTDKYLTFGPHEECPYELMANGVRDFPNKKQKNNVLHPCFGQFWARTVLKEMFCQLTDPETGLDNLTLPKSKTKTFFDIPDHLMVSFKGEI